MDRLVASNVASDSKRECVVHDVRDQPRDDRQPEGGDNAAHQIKSEPPREDEREEEEEQPPQQEDEHVG
eukprot:6523575-Prymnesium_polylepis.1